MLAVAITVQVEQRPDAEALLPPTVSVPPDRVDRFDTPAEKENKAQAEPSKPLADAGPPPARERRKAPVQQAAPAASPPAEVKPQAAEVARADRLEAQQRQAPAVEMQSAPAAAPAAPPPSAQADNRGQSSGAAGVLFGSELARRGGEAGAAADPAAAPPAEAAPKPQAKVREGRVTASAAPLSPDRLLERIAELRKEGRHDEADKALAEFRQRYPDYRISDEMLKKVERQK